MGYINRHKVFFAVQRQVYPANFQEKTITPNNFQREITPDAGYDALSKVKLNGILVDAHTEIESQVDSDVKYTKTVPAGALQYAGLNKVGGMSYKFNQLIQNGNFVDSSHWVANGGTLSVLDNKGTFTPTQQYGNLASDIVDMINGHKYLIRLNIQLSVGTSGVVVRLNNDTTQNISVLANTNKQSLSFVVTPTQSNRIQIIDSRASDWGNIQVENVMVHDLTDMYGAGNEPTTVDEFKARFNKDYYDYTLPTLHHSPVTEILSNETLNIPAQVQLLNGYGMGINSTQYNYIDFESKKFKANVKIIDMGTLNWIYSSGYFYADLSDQKIVDTYISNTKHLLCGKYECGGVQYEQNFQEKKCYNAPNSTSVYVKDSDYENATLFKEAMSGVYLLYELATPVETDISEYITQDTLDVINTITFENEYEQAVPSEINYLIEV